MLIFAKLPKLSFVKTRLESEILSKQDVLNLYEGFLLDTIHQSVMSKVDTVLFSLTDTESIISENLGDFTFFTKQKIDDVNRIFKKVHVQPNGSFGQRMKSSIKWAINLGFGKLIIIGADSPQIQPGLLDNAMDLLKEYDFVLGPSPAGGIYLIGLGKNINLDGFEKIFDGVELINMVNLIQNQQKTIFLLEELTDIDTLEDLIGLIAWINAAKVVNLESASKELISIPSNTDKKIQELSLVVIPDKTNNRNKTIKKDSTEVLN